MKLNENIEKILINPIFISFIVFLIVAVIVYLITISKVEPSYDDQFVRDVLVEAHGMLFDILFIGTLIFGLHTLVEKRRERKRNIERWKEEIDDIRYWKSKEAMYKIVGNIKRLGKNGVTQIDLRRCFLKHASLRGARLVGASLREAKLQNANLWQAELLKANFWKAELNGANLKEANLQNAILTQAQLEGVILDEANLQGADLRGSLELFQEQLAKAKTLYNAQLDEYLMSIMKESYPKLFEKPKKPNK